MKHFTIPELQQMRESEDHVEFKKAEQGNMAYDGGTKGRPHDRRKCILGYVVALCNEEGGRLVLGMEDNYPHKVVGTSQNFKSIGILESNIFRDVHIRPMVYELYDENNRRVLVIEVPPRPYGHIFKFEDVPLMRVGEELLPMSDQKYISIIHEQEPDFSMQVCPDASIEDLDKEAIHRMKQKYAKKQRNPSFESLSDAQALSDLGLILDGKITNAALLLVGRKSFLEKHFPQAKIMLEYRGSESQIPFDNRTEYKEHFILLLMNYGPILT